MAVEFVVVSVPIADSWLCERCEAREVIAYVAHPKMEETAGYCRKCLAIVVVDFVSTPD